MESDHLENESLWEMIIQAVQSLPIQIIYHLRNFSTWKPIYYIERRTLIFLNLIMLKSDCFKCLKMIAQRDLKESSLRFDYFR